MENLHGGDVYTYQGVRDLSANINPFGVPDRILSSINKSLCELPNYPDYACRGLRKKLAEDTGCKKEWIICGNGAADLLFTLAAALKPKKALLAVPGFAEYEEALNTSDTELIYYFLQRENGYQMSEEYLKLLTPDMEMAFLCSPNNPTGAVVKKELLLKIIRICKENHILLVVDECFNDFLEEPEEYSVIDQIGQWDNLFILRSFTKMFAIAGLRLGYGITSNQDIIEKMYKFRQPWPVSIPAQAAGIAAVDEKEFVDRTRAFIRKEKEYIYKELERLDVKYWKSAANYIMFQCCTNLKERLLKHQILIRDCSNYKNLDKGHYRVAVKSHEDNSAFIKGLEAELKNA